MDSNSFSKFLLDLLSRCQFRVAEWRGIGGILADSDS